MASANTKETFSTGVKKIWEIVTSCEHYSWRSDLSRIEVIEAGKKFIEYTKDGYPTTFTITAFEPYKRYEFDMENSNMTGHWTGIFRTKDHKTHIDFTEEVRVKKIFMKPFAGIYLKKQQKKYFEDLKKALGER